MSSGAAINSTLASGDLQALTDIAGTLPAKSLDAVIFDFDGVLADTEDIFARYDGELLHNALRRAGCDETLPLSYIRSLAGHPPQTKLEMVFAHLGLPDAGAHIEAFIAERDQTRGNLFKTNPPKLAIGLREFLAAYKGRYALATNKDSEKARIDLADFGLRDDFPDELMFCRSSTLRKKPAPDILLAALDYLGADAARTAYIGDNDIDMLAAKNAGLVPVGFIINPAAATLEQIKTIRSEMPLAILSNMKKLSEAVD